MAESRAENSEEVQELLSDEIEISTEVEQREPLRDNNTKTESKRRIALSIAKSWWRKIVIVLIPIILLPIPIVIDTQPSYAFYGLAIIAVYWITEAIPLAATSLLPMVLFPALGVLSAQETAQNYLNDTNMLFVGGLMVAVAIEKWDLHKRIALLVLLCVGSNPKWLLFGFMSVTAFLSMWISNTATAAMMLPISHAVLQEIQGQCVIEDNDKENNGRTNENVTLVAKYVKNYNGLNEEDAEVVDITESDNVKQVVDEDSSCEDDRKDKPSHSSNRSFGRLAKGLTLGIAYSANIGGTGTLTGTGPNLILSGDMAKLFPKSGGINFGVWFVFAFPAMIISLFFSWIYLSIIFCDDFLQWFKVKFFKMNQSEFSTTGTRKVLLREYKKLGPWKFAEIQVMILFVSLAVLWLFREPKFMPGWGEIFKVDSESSKSYFSDSSAAMFIVFLLFVLPAKSCLSLQFRRKRPYFTLIQINANETLLDWDSVQHKLPWNVVLLLGAGFAIAEAAEVSGLSCWLGNKLLVIEPLPDSIKALTVSVTVASITEIFSNVATTTLFLPILAQLAISLSINPLYLMIPATVSASYAFMLPVATPPNAIAFSFGYLKVYDMVFTGILMNIICIFIVNLAVNTWAVPLFDLHTFPNWTSTNTSSNCEL